MDRSKQLGTEKVLKLLFKFSIPAIVGMLVNALYNVVDRAFVGQSVGELGIAGVTVCFPLMLAWMGFMMLVGLGGNSLVSIRLGEGKKEEAEKILANSFVLLIIISLLLTAFGYIFMVPILKLIGASAQALPYAQSYMQIILLGSIFQGLGFGMNNFIRGEGNPKIAMFTMLLGAVLNAILCYLFVYRMGWGVKGSAWATVISQGVSAAWVLHYFFANKSSLKIHKANLRLEKEIALKIFALGSAPFLLQLAASLVNAILNSSLGYYGSDTAISAMGIVSSILSLVLMPLFGINQGMQPIIGYNYGAKKFDRVKEALKWAIIGATIIVVIGFIATQAFPRQIVSIFNKEDVKLIDFSVYTMRVFLILLPLIGFQVVSSNYFQAIGKPKHSAFLSLSRQLILLIPLVIILPLFFGLHGVIMAGPAADLGSSLLTGFWIFRELKRLDTKHEKQQRFLEIKPEFNPEP